MKSSFFVPRIEVLEGRFAPAPLLACRIGPPPTLAEQFTAWEAGLWCKPVGPDLLAEAKVMDNPQLAIMVGDMDLFPII